MPGFGNIVSGLGKVIDTALSFQSADDNRDFERANYRHAIQWRVQDAQKAGIHPLYALGAPTFSSNPQYITSDFGGLGQDISRSIEANRDAQERAVARKDALVTSAAQAAADKLTLENMGLQNDLLRSQIARLNSAQIGPPAPPLTMGSMALDHTSDVVPVPAQPVIDARGNPAREAGIITDYGYVRSENGITVTPSQDMYNRIQDNLPQELAWMWRNQIAPAVGGLSPPPVSQYPLPPGFVWHWNPWAQAFQPTDDGGRTHNISPSVLNYYRRH